MLKSHIRKLSLPKSYTDHNISKITPTWSYHCFPVSLWRSQTWSFGRAVLRFLDRCRCRRGRGRCRCRCCRCCRCCRRRRLLRGGLAASEKTQKTWNFLPFFVCTFAMYCSMWNWGPEKSPHSQAMLSEAVKTNKYDTWLFQISQEDTCQRHLFRSKITFSSPRAQVEATLAAGFLANCTW